MIEKNFLDFTIIKKNRIDKKTISILVDLVVKGVGEYTRNHFLRHAKTKSISSSRNHFLIAMNNDEILGFLMYRIDKEISFLYEIHVDENYRFMGIGGRLMEEYFSDQMEQLLILFVHKNNLIAQGFYRKLGFTPDENFNDKYYFKYTKNN